MISIENEWNLWYEENTSNLLGLQNPLVQEITQNNFYHNFQKLNSTKHFTVGQLVETPFSQKIDQLQVTNTNDVPGAC